MKRSASAILLIIYFVLSSGVVFNLHYCMNKIDSLQLGASKSDVCGRCGMHTEDSNGCCKDELKFVKIQDDQQASTANYNFEPIVTIVHTPEVILNEEIQVSNIDHPVNNHSPPIHKEDIHVLNCVFRI